MGTPKKQSTNSSNNEISKIQKEISRLSKISAKLQAEYKIMSKSLKDINKTLKFLIKTVQNNKEFIDNHSIEPENANIEANTLLTENKHGERTKIDRETFLPALKTILLDLKKEDEKEFIEIITVKKGFMKKYFLDFETDFDHWLLECYWSNEIELISGISDYGIRDIYENVYHNIKF
jgi:hypothetical protein